MAFKNISNEQHDLFISALRAGQYNLLLGAGASMDSTNAFGALPSGEAFTRELCAHKNVSKRYSLQRVFSILSNDEIERLVTNRMNNCVAGKVATGLCTFIWKRIFTWNIDDVLQKAYEAKGAKQSLRPFHYSDPYLEATNPAELIAVYLHGSVTQAAKGYVFSREAYIGQIKSLNHWMIVLTQFMITEPMIVMGTSLDEVDLDYYLSFRTPITSRSDRAPSILVERGEDAIIDELCKKHDLLQFEGYAQDFIDYCIAQLPVRPTPVELIEREMKAILPALVSKRAALAFHTDFELVPGVVSAKDEATNFLYGAAPSWEDLASNLDVPRSLTAQAIAACERGLADESAPRLVLISDNAGTGKTTIIRRAAFELARRGHRVLNCTTLSRIDRATPDIVDQIDGHVVVVCDNFVDQAATLDEMFARLERRDIVILGAERKYRLSYINKAASALTRIALADTFMQPIDVERLLDRYTRYGLVGDHSTIKNRPAFTQAVIKDPISVACCRIMNDYKPLDRILSDLIEAGTPDQLETFLLVAIAQHCFKGGLRYEVLVSCIGREMDLRPQFNVSHPLPLAYFDNSKNFVIPANATIAERILANVAFADRGKIGTLFKKLANAIAPRVNRDAIITRSPEARLAGRLFDFDDITSKILGVAAEAFYNETRQAWRWNSRYWEQLALLKLATYYSYRNDRIGIAALDQAVRHARHAVTTELHPFPLSTLGKVLMTKMSIDASHRRQLYDEAFRKLSKAIELEAAWSRNAIQPFASLFRGTIMFVKCGNTPSGKQVESLQDFMRSVDRRFGGDLETQILLGEIAGCLESMKA